MKPSDNIEETIKKELKFTAGTKMRNRILGDVLQAHENSKKTQSALTSPNLRRQIMKSPITKLAGAAAIIIAVSVVINPFGNSATSVAWADVAERFESIPFFHLTMYMGYDTSNESEKIEIWKSEDSRVRAIDEDTVIFADFRKKEIEVVAFDRFTKEFKKIPEDEKVPMFLMLLCKDGRFSLDTLTKSLPPEVKGITPVETIDTAASRETVLFEAKHETTPERLTIWALRQSKLPIRLRFEDPRKSEYGDFLFDYSEQKDASFFDPNSFAQQ